jgi:hypothetical protein
MATTHTSSGLNSWASPSALGPLKLPPPSKDIKIFIPDCHPIDEATEAAEMERERKKLEERRKRKQEKKKARRESKEAAAAEQAHQQTWSVEEYHQDTTYGYARSELEHDDMMLDQVSPAVVPEPDKVDVVGHSHTTADSKVDSDDDDSDLRDVASTSGEDTDDEQFALRHYKREMNERIRWERLVKTPKFSKEDLEMNDQQFLVSRWFATYSIADPVPPRRSDTEWEEHGRQLAALHESRKAERAALAASQRRRRESEMGFDDFAFVLGDIDDEDEDPLALSPTHAGYSSSSSFKRKRGRPPKPGGKGRTYRSDSLASSGASQDEDDYDVEDMFGDDDLFQLASDKKKSAANSAARARQRQALAQQQASERSALTHSAPVSTNAHHNKHKRRKSSEDDNYTAPSHVHHPPPPQQHYHHPHHQEDSRQREQENRLQRIYDSTFFWVPNRDKRPPIDPETKRPRNIVVLKKVNLLDLTSTMFLPPGIKPGQPWRVVEAEAEARARAEEEAKRAAQVASAAAVVAPVAPVLRHPTPQAAAHGRSSTRLHVMAPAAATAAVASAAPTSAVIPPAGSGGAVHSPSKDEHSHIDIENVSDDEAGGNAHDPSSTAVAIDHVVGGLDPTGFMIGGLLHDTKLGVGVVGLGDADIHQDLHLDFSTMDHLIPTSDLHLDGDDLSL